MNLTGAQPANADSKAATGRLYRSTDLCVDAASRIFDDEFGQPGSPRASTSTYSRTQAFGITCGAPWLRPYGYIRANIQLFMWGYLNGVGPAWYLCRESNWKYNLTETATYNLTWEFSVQPCGHTWYGQWSTNGVRNGPSWFGGDLWSGYLYVDPDTSSSAALASGDFVVTDEFVQSATAPPGPPPGSKPPRIVPVVGPDGDVLRDARGKPVLVDRLNPGNVALGEIISAERTVGRGPDGELAETLTIVGR